MCMSDQTVTPPADHNTVNPFVIVSKATEFIDFVTQVFDGRESTAFRIPDRDGLLIHAEVVIGDSSILICDRKPDWPFTPAFLQVYVSDSQAVLDRAVTLGATTITPVSTFYGGYSLARLRDPWNNLWWLYTPDATDSDDRRSESSTSDWQEGEPSRVYTTIVQAMRDLRAPEAE
jgi:PhnB protein